MTFFLPSTVTQENVLQLEKEGLLNLANLRTIDCSALKDFDSTVLTVLLAWQKKLLSEGKSISVVLEQPFIVYNAINDNLYNNIELIGKVVNRPEKYNGESISHFSGDIGNNISASGNYVAPYISVPQVKDIILTCSGSSTNRITQFSYSISCPKKPIYLLQPSGLSSGGSGPSGPTANYAYVPNEILLELPIEIDASFNLEVDDYQARKLYTQLNNDDDASFSININGTVFADEVLTVGGQNLTVNGGSDLILYKKLVGINMFNQSFANVKLISQEFNSSADDILSVKLNYKGYLNN
jgi:phospholipid transport system transporter-binding protein